LLGRKPVGAIIVEGGYCYVQIMSGDVPFTSGKPVGEQMTGAAQHLHRVLGLL